MNDDLMQKNALKARRQMPSMSAMIMRDGRHRTGDKVPADQWLFRVKGLQAQEVPHKQLFFFATNHHGK